jgi:hypothetical protein
VKYCYLWIIFDLAGSEPPHDATLMPLHSPLP